MEEVLIRFPHLGDKILKKLDCKSLVNCKEVNRTFENLMKVEKRSYLHAIQWYTNCSEPLMREIVEKYGAAIIILAILREIYGKFCRNTKQHHKYLQKHDSTPLHVAAKMGQSGAYHLIMENVANKNPFNMISDAKNWKCMRGQVDKRTGFYSNTPLHLAAKNGNFSVCKLIIENVLDKNPSASLYPELRKQRIVTNDQWTPLHLAANFGHFSICELIINNISEKNPKDEQDWTPLHSAAQNGHLRVCELILSNIQKCNTVHTGNPQSYKIDAASGWAGWVAHPEFERSFYPIRLRGADYAHHITASPLRFENPAASLYNPCDKLGNTPFKLATQFSHQQISTIILKFIYDAEERKGTFDDFKIQFVQDLERQHIENQENKKKKGVNDSHDHSYQIMKVMQENKKWEEQAKYEKKKGQKYGTFGLDADDRDDREINRERVRTGAAGARTRRYLGYHLLHPQNLTDQFSD